MLPTFTSYLLFALELITIVASCDAEVRLTHSSLTMDVHDAAMEDILDDLRYQGNLNIVALEETKIGNVKISKKFWNLPLEEGLNRLLSGWNYVITRDISTGNITTLYLVSQRQSSSSAPVSLPTSTSQAISLDRDTAQSRKNTFDNLDVDSLFLESNDDSQYSH